MHLAADHRIVGIMSERDIVQALAEHGVAVLSEPVSQVMTREVKTCSEDDTIGPDGPYDHGKIPPFTGSAEGKTRRLSPRKKGENSYRLINARFNVAVYQLDGVPLEKIAAFLEPSKFAALVPRRDVRSKSGFVRHWLEMNGLQSSLAPAQNALQ
jgi:hypothetical protein